MCWVWEVADVPFDITFVLMLGVDFCFFIIEGFKMKSIKLMS